MNKIIKVTVVIGVLTILLDLGLATTALSEVEAKRRDGFPVIELTEGSPTSFIIDQKATKFPKIVAKIKATTSEGDVMITQTVVNANEDILLGCTLGNSGSDQCDPGNPATRGGEHMVLEDEWNFGRGDKLYADTRVYIDEVSVLTNHERHIVCSEFINNRQLAIISRGTGRFAGAQGYIEMDIDEFCFDPDTFADPPVSVTGSIKGFIFLPGHDQDEDDD